MSHRTLHTKTAIYRHSQVGGTSRLRFYACLVRASLTLARWRNQSSAWDRTRDRMPSSFYYNIAENPVTSKIGG